jgi:hypothetical protein
VERGVDDPDRLNPCRVSVALSGGGHRASGWGIGTLYGLLKTRDAEYAKGADGRPFAFTSVASVSGGSITNGVVARETDLDAVTVDDFRTALGPLIETVATKGLIPARGRTWGYFLTLIASLVAFLVALVVAVTVVATVGRGDPSWGDLAPWYGAAVVVVAVLLLIVPRVRAARRHAPPPPAPVVVVVAVVAIAAIAYVTHRLAANTHGTAAWIAAVACVVGVALLGTLAVSVVSRRGDALRRALDRFHFHGDRLADLRGKPTRHVFCATELQSGHQCFLSSDLVIEWNSGEGAPGQISLATAAQSSAALPGGFPPVELDLDALGVQLTRPWEPDGAPPAPVRGFVLADGGVYDNMGDEWELGYADRARRSHLLDPAGAANFLVVANAGKNLGWKSFGASGRLTRELRGLMRDQSIEYDATTSQRRRMLLALFRQSEQSGKGLVGALAHVPTTPSAVCDAFQHDKDTARAARATACKHALDTCGEQWDAISRRNGNVSTTLGAISKACTVDLILHAATLTAVSCHVVHGIGDPSAIPTRDEITAWVDAATAPRT